MTSDTAENFFHLARNIKLLVLDVDGVLSDGQLLIDGHGNESKSFSARDGHGIKELQQFGVEIAIISGRQSAAVTKRMAELGVERVYQGFVRKGEVFAGLAKECGVRLEEVACMGDDLPDLPMLQQAGFSGAPADAHELVKKHVHWVSYCPGGHGAVREMCEYILRASSRMDTVVAQYLS